MFWAAMIFALLASATERARLTQFRGRVKKPRMLGERIAVGHAGDEIGDAARAAGLIGIGEALAPFRRQRAGDVGCSARKSARTTSAASSMTPHDARMAIHVRLQKALDGAAPPRQRPARSPTSADGAARTSSAERGASAASAPSGLGDDILDQRPISRRMNSCTSRAASRRRKGSADIAR